MTTGQLFYDPIARPLSAVGVAMPGAYYNFYLSGTTAPATVYQDAALSLPYPTASLNGTPAIYSVVQADGSGAFAPIFLAPTTIYRVQLYTSNWQLLEDVDPYIPAMPTVGNGQLVLNTAGEAIIEPPAPGGTGVTLTVDAAAGGTAVQLTGSGAGAPTVIANNTVVAGAQTATFAATNKPGSATSAPSTWLPITCDGATYYIPLWE